MKNSLAFLFCILLFACSTDKEIAGASTVETENACIINVVNIDAKPVSYAVARIRPLWYVQGTSSNSQNDVLELTTDSLGNIVMDSADFDKGYIEIIDGNEGVFRAIAASDLKKNKLTTVQLEELGSVSGKADIPEGSDYAWIQVYGTDKLIKTNEKGEFTLDSLPPASYQIRAVISEGQAAIGEASVKVSAGEKNNIKTLAKPNLTNEQLEQWAHLRVIPLDSTISDWMRPIADTTVVFVRLDSVNFDFGERFSETSRTANPHQRDLKHRRTRHVLGQDRRIGCKQQRHLERSTRLARDRHPFHQDHRLRQSKTRNCIRLRRRHTRLVFQPAGFQRNDDAFSRQRPGRIRVQRRTPKLRFPLEEHFQEKREMVDDRLPHQQKPIKSRRD